MKLRTSVRCLTVLTAGLITSAAFAANQTSNLPQELWPAPAAASSTSASASAAEVRADLLLWQQAGMHRFNQGEGVSFDSVDYERRLSHYQELRQSPAFHELVQKLQTQQ